jgi:hypothetical protein
MDYDNPQFAAAVRKILRKIVNDAPDASDEAQHQTEQGYAHMFAGTGGTSSQPTESHYDVTCHEKRDFWDWVKYGIEILGLVLLAIYTGYTIKMYRANNKSANAADSAAHSARDSVDLTRKNARFDQRAWLGISFSTYHLVLNRPLGPVVHIVDTGRTAARNAHGNLVTVFLRTDVPFRGFQSNHGTKIELGTMMQGVPQDAVSWLVDPDAPINIKKAITITKPMQDAFTSGRAYVMVYGTIEYDSVFGAHHWIKTCGTSNQVKFSVPKECVEYNDVDANEEP